MRKSGVVGWHKQPRRPERLLRSQVASRKVNEAGVWSPVIGSQAAEAEE